MKSRLNQFSVKPYLESLVGDHLYEIPFESVLSQTVRLVRRYLEILVNDHAAFRILRIEANKLKLGTSRNITKEMFDCV